MEPNVIIINFSSMIQNFILDSERNKRSLGFTILLFFSYFLCKCKYGTICLDFSIFSIKGKLNQESKKTSYFLEILKKNMGLEI